MVTKKKEDCVFFVTSFSSIIFFLKRVFRKNQLCCWALSQYFSVPMLKSPSLKIEVRRGMQTTNSRLGWLRSYDLRPYVNQPVMRYIPAHVTTSDCIGWVCSNTSHLFCDNLSPRVVWCFQYEQSCSFSGVSSWSTQYGSGRRGIKMMDVRQLGHAKKQICTLQADLTPNFESYNSKFGMENGWDRVKEVQ